jgi:hypothetical protein
MTTVKVSHRFEFVPHSPPPIDRVLLQTSTAISPSLAHLTFIQASNPNMAALFSALVALTAGLQAFLILYFIIALSTVLLAFHKSLRPEPEEVWVARIKGGSTPTSISRIQHSILTIYCRDDAKAQSEALQRGHSAQTRFTARQGMESSGFRLRATIHPGHSQGGPDAMREQG